MDTIDEINVKGNKEFRRQWRIMERLIHSKNCRIVKIEISAMRCEDCGATLIREECLVYDPVRKPLVWIVCPFSSNEVNDEHSLFLYDEETKEIN